MNERIRELARRVVGKHRNDVDSISLFDEQIEQFAELIVRECAGILMTPEYPINHPEELGDYNRGWVNGRLLSIEHIKEHFGVEL